MSLYTGSRPGRRAPPAVSGLAMTGLLASAGHWWCPRTRGNYRPAMGLSVGNLSNFLGNQPRPFGQDAKVYSAIVNLPPTLEHLKRETPVEVATARAVPTPSHAPRAATVGFLAESLGAATVVVDNYKI